MKIIQIFHLLTTIINYFNLHNKLSIVSISVEKKFFKENFIDYTPFILIFTSSTIDLYLTLSTLNLNYYLSLINVFPIICVNRNTVFFDCLFNINILVNNLSNRKYEIKKIEPANWIVTRIHDQDHDQV